MPQKTKIETPESKLAEISKDIVKVEKEASAIKIENRQDYEKASGFLVSTIKARINRIEELAEFFTKPHQEARKKALDEMRKIEALFAKSLEPLKAIEMRVKRSMSDFMLAEEAAAKKEEARLAALRNKQDERREEKGLEPIATPLPTIARPEATVATEAGKATAKKVWKFEITNFDILPKEVISAVLFEAQQTGLTEKIIRKMVNAGIREINGVRIYEDFDISAQTR